MPKAYFHFIVLLLILLHLHFGVGLPLAQAAPPVLVWQPYLQQLTDTGVIILWTTAEPGEPAVHYAPDTSYSSSAGGSSRSLPTGVTLHRVELTGLTPDTVYTYKIYIDGQDLLPDKLLWFQTATPPGSETVFTFAAFGDFGKNSDSQKQLRDRMVLDYFRFLITTGDNAYNSGTYAEFDTNVFQIYQDLFSKVPVFPALGNHDYATGGGAPYLDIFELPPTAWRLEDRERYYAFDYGNVHFTVLDSNAPLNADDALANDDMFDWLRADLSQTGQPWKVVIFHHPAYSTGSHGSEGRVQSKLVPIFENYGVDLVLNGHDHIYQRSYPLRQGQVVPLEAGGIVYLVTGAGSAANYPCEEAIWVAFSRCNQADGLYTRFTVNGNTLTLKAIDETGASPDSYTLTNFTLPLASVTLTGPATGLVGAGHSFTAHGQPLTTMLPLTYTWEATHQAPVTLQGGLAEAMMFQWNIPGTQTIIVTVANSTGSVSTTHTLMITEPSEKVYLPLLVHY